MKKLLLYLTMTVVLLLSVLPREVQATPYSCTDCTRPFSILNGLNFLTNGSNTVWVYTEDPMYPLSDNNEAAWDAVTWDEVANSMSKPSWSGLSSAYWNDTGYDWLMLKDLSVTYSPLKEDVADVQTDITILAGDMAAMEATVGGLPSPTEFSDMEGDLAGKMDQPSGTTGQYVRGDGSLASFPSIPDAQVQSDWTAGSGVAQILNKPTLGTAAALNAAAAGNAGSGEVVKGDDTRLSDSRTPSAHTHGAGDVVSGTFADGRISQSSVTQHEAAMVIGTAQVTGLVEHEQDNVLGVITAGAGLSYTYDDTGNAASVSLASKTYQTPTFNSATTATRLSTSREADVFYAFDATVSISLLAGQSVTATLKYADDSGMSTNLVTVDSAATSNSGVLGLTQANTLRVGGKIPANKYRQVTFAVTGSGAAAPTTIKAGQEAF